MCLVYAFVHTACRRHLLLQSTYVHPILLVTSAYQWLLLCFHCISHHAGMCWIYQDKVHFVSGSLFQTQPAKMSDIMPHDLRL